MSAFFDGIKGAHGTPVKPKQGTNGTEYAAGKWVSYSVVHGLALVAIHFSIATLFNKFKGREVISSLMSQVQAGVTVTLFSAFVDGPYVFKGRDIRLLMNSGWDLYMYLRLLSSITLGAFVPTLLSRFGFKVSVQVLPTVSFALLDATYLWGVDNCKESRRS